MESESSVADFADEEIKATVWSCGNRKSLGPIDSTKNFLKSAGV